MAAQGQKKKSVQNSLKKLYQTDFQSFTLLSQLKNPHLIPLTGQMPYHLALTKNNKFMA